jgi:hypothetical protein
MASDDLAAAQPWEAHPVDVAPIASASNEAAAGRLMDPQAPMGGPLGHWLCKFAVLNESLEQLSWLRSTGCPWGEDTCTAASGMGNLHILQWARG